MTECADSRVVSSHKFSKKTKVPQFIFLIMLFKNKRQGSWCHNIQKLLSVNEAHIASFVVN